MIAFCYSEGRMEEIEKQLLTISKRLEDIETCILDRESELHQEIVNLQKRFFSNIEGLFRLIFI